MYNFTFTFNNLAQISFVYGKIPIWYTKVCGLNLKKIYNKNKFKRYGSLFTGYVSHNHLMLISFFFSFHVSLSDCHCLALNYKRQKQKTTIADMQVEYTHEKKNKFPCLHNSVTSLLVFSVNSLWLLSELNGTISGFYPNTSQQTSNRVYLTELR